MKNFLEAAVSHQRKLLGEGRGNLRRNYSGAPSGKQYNDNSSNFLSKVRRDIAFDYLNDLLRIHIYCYCKRVAVLKRQAYL